MDELVEFGCESASVITADVSSVKLSKEETINLLAATVRALSSHTQILSPETQINRNLITLSINLAIQSPDPTLFKSLLN